MRLFTQESIIRNGPAHYQRVSEQTLSARDTELAAFNMVNRDLENADTEQRRILAIGRNHQLWSILVRDLALANNGLPEALRSQLIELGFWSMHYSIQATLQKMPVEPLLTVNRNIVEGLLAQKMAATNANPNLGQPVAV